jgi:glutamate/aspartate transport system substrate-binding protein
MYRKSGDYAVDFVPSHTETQMKRISILLAGLVVAGSMCATAIAQDTLKKIRDSGSITIGHRDASIPFSYYDDKQQPIGFAMDLCLRIVDAVKAELKMPKLEVKYQLVTSANRIPLMANGTIDLECGSTTNNAARQEQVAFAITHFLTANRYVSKKSSNIKSIEDLKGKTIVSTAGTTNIKQATDLNVAKNMGMNIISANGHPEAFQMVETGRAVAFVMDDILLYTLVAQSRSPGDYVISSDALSLPEPYGIMLRKGDTAFKKVVDATMIQTYKSGAINAIYEKWFLKPVPPKGINYNVPMSPQFKNLIGSPSDSPDPAAYK